MAEDVVELTAATLEAEVSTGSTPYLVDFWASWCPPCHEVAEVLRLLTEDYRGRVRFGSVDVLAHGAAAERFEVIALPTLIAFVDGRPARRIAGARSREQLRAELDRILAGSNPKPR